MKKLWKIVPLLLVVFFTLNTTHISAIDNFEIDDLNVVIDVNEDGTYDVVEDYTINFTSPALGIYRDLIAVQEMEWDLDGDLVRKTYNFPLTDIEVSGDVYYVESQLNGKRIVLGPDDGPRFTGEKEYQVKYKVHSKPIDLPEQNEAFFYNLVSDWDAVMHNFNATVNFYEDINLEDLQVVGTSYSGNFDVACKQNSKSSFSCAYDEDVYFGQGRGITALVPLGNDFFIRDTANYIYYIGFGLSALILIISGLLWSMYGKDDPVVEVISFNPPKGYNSAMVGYVYDDTVDNDDLYSLLFYWANQGLIEIKEEKKDKLTFTRLGNLTDDVPAFEKDLFNMMFYKDGPITTKDWQKHDLFTKLQMTKSKVSNAVKKLGGLYTTRSKSLKGIIAAIAAIPMVYVIFASTNFSVKQFGPAIAFAVFTFVVFIIGFTGFNEAQKKNRQKRSFALTSSIIFIIVMLGLLFVGYVFFSNMLGVNLNIIMIMIIAAITSLTFILAHFMQKRSEYGSRIYGEILGLRAFIKYAKVDELLVMQEENPHLYYDVLPYAYAFGMSDLWNEHFKTIEIPQSQYYSTYRTGSYTNFLMMNSLVRSINQVPSQVMPKVQSGSGGASFGGGGFSGGGGGFSGGGGFGGGGGGGR